MEKMKKNRILEFKFLKKENLSKNLKTKLHVFEERKI